MTFKLPEPVAWRYGAILYSSKVEAVDFMRYDNTGYALETLFTADQVLAAYEQGKAENAKDAERYRWLRHGDNDEHVLLTYDREIGVRPFDWRFDDVWLPRNKELDAAIDRALKESASRAIQAPKEGALIANDAAIHEHFKEQK